MAREGLFLGNRIDARGSWAMISRAGGLEGKSAKNQAPIGYADTAWSIMGPMRSTPAQVKGETQAGNLAK